MKKLAALLVLVACTHVTNQKTVRLAGWVSDAACGVEHAKPKSSAACVRKCVKESGMVLVLHDTQKIYAVTNPESLLGREAERVVVEAVVDGETVRVVRVVQ